MGKLHDWRSRPRRPRPDLSERNRASAIHGMNGTPTWKSWNAMCQRIRNPKNKDFPNYGGRGIDMDPRWNDFSNFYKDMGLKPSRKTLGRIDNNLGYWPHNCRWETKAQQDNNKRTNRHLSIDGKVQTIAQWARELGLSRQALRYRVQSGWPEEALVSKPDRTIRRR